MNSLQTDLERLATPIRAELSLVFNMVDFHTVLRFLVIVTIKVFSQPSCADTTARAITCFTVEKQREGKEESMKLPTRVLIVMNSNIII